MSEKTVLIGFCALVALVSLATVVWVLATGQFHDVDGLMLISVCLLAAAIFGGLVLFDQRERLRHLLAFRSRKPAPAPATAGKAVPAQAPASPVQQQAAGASADIVHKEVRMEASEGGAVHAAAAAVHEHAAVTTRLYLAVWGGLLSLTLLELLLAYQHLPLTVMLAMLMSLSCVKAALIMAYFMHLRFERLNLVLMVVPTLVIVISLLFMFFPDSFRVTVMGVK